MVAPNSPDSVPPGALAIAHPQEALVRGQENASKSFQDRRRSGVGYLAYQKMAVGKPNPWTMTDLTLGKDTKIS